MADWNINNKADLVTWWTLRSLTQIGNEVVFSTAGTIKMGDLTFFSHTASGDERKAAARSLAIAIDNHFRGIWGAVFEKGVDKGKAFQDIVDALVDEKKTVADLGAVADNDYKFPGE